MTDVFQYPSKPHVRQHGPRGYRNYESYKPWLRDEFSFRCVYCLCRERWFPDGEAAFSVDHVRPQSLDPDSVSIYENLLYSCCQCNAIRGTDMVPDPCVDAYGELLHIQSDGTVTADSEKGRDLIDICRLNRPALVAFRVGMMEVLAKLASRQDPDGRLLRHILGFPDSLPNLSRLRPPSGNTKSDGIPASPFAHRERGQLTSMY
jgi:hypothetical protein